MKTINQMRKLSNNDLEEYNKQQYDLWIAYVQLHREIFRTEREMKIHLGRIGDELRARHLR